MKWHIVSDSSCDLRAHEINEENVDLTIIPFFIQIGQASYTDDESMDVDAMLTANAATREKGKTACPSPQSWLDAFSQPGPVIAVTISSELSGSYSSACVAMEMIKKQEPDKQIAVVNSRATGAETVHIICGMRDAINRGLSFEAVVAEGNRIAEKTHTVFALCSFHNLVKNGRVNPLVGLIAGHMGFWGIGAGDESGKIVIRAKVHGMRRMIHGVVEELRQNGLAGDLITICHCLNEETAQRLRDAILEAFQQVRVTIRPTLGLDSFYAERGGLIVGY